MPNTDQSEVLTPSSPAQPDLRVDVCVIGAGLLGLHNAMQYAKRGFTVAIVDELTERAKESFKVGESLLVFANAFLRTIGDLDKELSESFEKAGFWMAYGLEGKTGFDEDVYEWGFQNKLPQRWLDKIENQKFVRTMFGDVQIVRPEIEAALRERVSHRPEITFIDRGLARDITLGGADSDHQIAWRSRNGQDSGTVAARWLVDCSGRARVLAKRFGHDVPLTDDFTTSAVWAQFSGCTDAIFDERWNFTFPDGEVIRRDLDTVHLWGDGYWIWLIRLTGDRISVGVSFDRSRAPKDISVKGMFWDVLRRYPMLSFLTEEQVLEFRAYRDVQYISDTYVSPQRYAIAGDAASIIDAYYSQGISLSVSTSWHAANIAEQDMRHGTLDTGYINHVNRASLADWRIMRSMVQAKYGPAMADSRFFILDHLLDYLIFGGALLGRYRISRWLADTDGCPSVETPELTDLRVGLTRRLYLSQAAPWHRMDPLRVARLVERWHAGLERRALWRLEHGISPRPTKAALRAHAALPGVWRFPILRWKREADLTLPAIKEPEFMRVKGTEKRPIILAGSGPMLVAFNTYCLVFDIVDTAVRKAVYMLMPNRRRRLRTAQVALNYRRRKVPAKEAA